MSRQRAIRRGPTGHRIGESHHMARADDHDVELARQLRFQHHLSYGAIAEKFEVSKTAVIKWCSMETRYR